MHINRHVSRYIEDNVPEPQSIRRLADGSIDFKFYDDTARICRSQEFRMVGSMLVRFVVHLKNVLTGPKPGDCTASLTDTKPTEPTSRLELQRVADHPDSFESALSRAA